MSTTEETAGTAIGTTGVGIVDLKLEVVVLPVADADRAKEFYTSLGWRLDADFAFDNGFRILQITPPGSSASIQFGPGVTTSEPGAAQNNYLIVSDIGAARDNLSARGVDVTEVFHPAAPGDQFRSDSSTHLGGPAPASYGSFASFEDPDGNRWLLQEVTSRLPGRIDGDATSFGSVHDLAAALRRAEAAHGEHEKRTGVADPDWPDWYARYLVAEGAGEELPT